MVKSIRNLKVISWILVVIAYMTTIFLDFETNINFFNICFSIGAVNIVYAYSSYKDKKQILAVVRGFIGICFVIISLYYLLCYFKVI